MKDAPPVGSYVRIPMGESNYRYRWNVRVIKVSEDGRFVKVGGNGVLAKKGKWIETAKVQLKKEEE